MSEERTHIAERVRFWEEQDRINQELIPRVIRQHELLTKHISDHEMLPIIAAAAAREAVEQAHGETLRQLEEAKTLNQELSRQLEHASTERKEQKKQHSEEVAELKGANLKTKIIATAACVAAIAAVVIAIIM